MKALITGGTGFIGSRLARHLLAEGKQVRIFGKTNTPAEEENARLLREQGAEMVNGSITDRDAVEKAVRERDTVFHLAAAQHEANIPDQVFWNVNVTGTENLLAACVTHGVRRLVHGSTIGVYGSSIGGVIDENSPLKPDNIYGKTKLAGEQAALAFSNRMPVAAIRISETYGPGDRRLLKLFRGINTNRFFVIGSGKNLHHPVYIDDLVNGLLLAAEKKEAVGQIFLLAGPAPVTTSEMVREIVQALGKKPLSLRLPFLPFLVVAWLMEATLKPLGIQPPLHRRRLDFFKKSFCLDTKKASALLGFSPATTFHDGAAKTAAWYKKQNLM